MPAIIDFPQVIKDVRHSSLIVLVAIRSVNIWRSI